MHTKYARPARDGAMPGGPLPAPDQEWQIIVQARPNVLIWGEKSHVESTIVSLVPHLAAPVVAWTFGDDRAALAGAATLIIRDVNHLTSDEQRLVYDWLTHAERRVQVLSTAFGPIAHMLEDGSFRSDLYYRINTICLDVSIAWGV
jgi:hypothetical protein